MKRCVILLTIDHGYPRIALLHVVWQGGAEFYIKSQSAGSACTIQVHSACSEHALRLYAIAGYGIVMQNK
jgi:hypothetical protein